MQTHLRPHRTWLEFSLLFTVGSRVQGPPAPQPLLLGYKVHPRLCTLSIGAPPGTGVSSHIHRTHLEHSTLHFWISKSPPWPLAKLLVLILLVGKSRLLRYLNERSLSTGLFSPVANCNASLSCVSGKGQTEGRHECPIQWKSHQESESLKDETKLWSFF